MTLARSTFIVFATFVSFMNCSEKPMGWKDAVSFANPFATFKPSIISKGHVQYFEPIERINDEQRKGLLKFISYLQQARLLMIMPIIMNAMSIYLNKPKYNIIAHLEMGLCCINFYYLYELKDFKEKIEKVVQDQNK